MSKVDEAGTEAILKVGEFIRQTGNEVMACKKATLAMIDVIMEMNVSLLKIEKILKHKDETLGE